MVTTIAEAAAQVADPETDLAPNPDLFMLTGDTLFPGSCGAYRTCV